jgi:hypothetical protein
MRTYISKGKVILLIAVTVPPSDWMVTCAIRHLDVLVRVERTLKICQIPATFLQGFRGGLPLANENQRQVTHPGSGVEDSGPRNQVRIQVEKRRRLTA